MYQNFENAVFPGTSQHRPSVNRNTVLKTILLLQNHNNCSVNNIKKYLAFHHGNMGQISDATIKYILKTVMNRNILKNPGLTGKFCECKRNRKFSIGGRKCRNFFMGKKRNYSSEGRKGNNFNGRRKGKNFIGGRKGKNSAGRRKGRNSAGRRKGKNSGGGRKGKNYSGRRKENNSKGGKKGKNTRGGKNGKNSIGGGRKSAWKITKDGSMSKF